MATYTIDTIQVPNGDECVLSDASAIKKTLTSAKGDMVYAAAANVPARLALGNSGEILTATADGPAWTSQLKSHFYNGSGNSLSSFLVNLDSQISDQGVRYVYVGYDLAKNILGLANSCPGIFIANSINNRVLVLYCIDNSRMYVITKQSGTWKNAFKSVTFN